MSDESPSIGEERDGHVLRPVRAAARTLFHAWGRAGRAPGWHYRMMERWGPLLAEPGGLSATLPNGTRMVCDLTDHVERHMYFLGHYEPIEAFLLTSLLQPGMTVIDGGANVGAHTLIAATAVGPAGAVHSFEPVPRTADRLEAQVADNGLDNVKVTRAALWYEADVVTLALPPDQEDNAGAFSLRGGDPASAVRAPALCLDDYVQEHAVERVDFIKLDLEGAELPALQGMLGVLERTRPLLLIEICRLTCDRFDYEPQAIWELLTGQLGYRGWAVGESSATSHEIDGLQGIDQQNVVFYCGALPDALALQWDLKSVLQWARSGG